METTYNFTTSQPLTHQQLEYLNNCLLNLPSYIPDLLEDIPVWTTEITPE